jgi:hypothetical protein
MDTSAFQKRLLRAARMPQMHPAVQSGAMVVSYIFHPVFMTLTVTMALWRLVPAEFAGMDARFARFWLGTIGVGTLFFPLLTVFLLRKLDFIRSVHLHDQKERIIPLIAIMVYYFWVYLVFKGHTGTPLILRSLLLGSFFGIVGIFLVNIFYKISMHAAAAGGMLTVMAILALISPTDTTPAFFVTMIVAGIIGSARLILRMHTPAEVWVGYLIGILSQTIAYLYLR